MVGVCYVIHHQVCLWQTCNHPKQAPHPQNGEVFGLIGLIGGWLPSMPITNAHNLDNHPTAPPPQDVVGGQWVELSPASQHPGRFLCGVG